ncbi:DDE-type integrase/transposase/recombinase [Christiangramia sp.]|uniref:DDE-type integrase/transposase/recombinase n=1 Tax=Christiangramia sp. TaxID=1931228 RepID=UPI00262E191A|nr:DDE-type integrase/transposase/recombinase [Christiangramia sp.]
MYLVAIIDLHSRYVLNWSVSNSMDAQWCKETLEEAIDIHGTPEIINTDQEASLPQRSLPTVYYLRISNSVWMVKEELSIMYLLKGFGEV